jgi:hypothetical protein
VSRYFFNELTNTRQQPTEEAGEEARIIARDMYEQSEKESRIPKIWGEESSMLSL